MLSDPVEVRRLGEAKLAENQDFRRHLSAHHHRENEFQIIASAIEPLMDCTQCANCCRYSLVAVTDTDVEQIAAFLGSPVVDVVRLYTVPDPHEPSRRLLKSTDDGCVFLDRNLCVIYEARPNACRMFPYVRPEIHALGSRLSSHARWAALCPIIYNAFEEYKHVIGYRPAAH